MNFWRNLSLSLRVPLLVVVLMVSVGIVASQLVLAQLDRHQAARIRELARLHVEALSVALGPHVLRNDIWEIYDTLERAAGASEGRRTMFSAVADENGRVLAATEPRRAPVDSPIFALSADAQLPGELSISSTEPRVRLLAPLIYQGRTVGQILTELDISDLVAERNATRQLLVFGNALATGLLALLGYFATRRMLLPITRLVNWMRDTEGAPRPIPDDQVPAGDSELAQLVHTYNDMVCAIEAKTDAERRLSERERFVSLGRLSSSLAHEINNPLGGLLNAADTIQQYADRPEVVRQSGELITRGLKHLRDVAKATLDQNRLDRTGAPLGMDDFDDLHLLIGPEVSRRLQSLDWQVEAAPEALAAFASAPVRQIVLNLLLNATEAAGQGGRLGLSVTVRNGHLCLTVSDSGPGLSDAACERLLGTGHNLPGGGVGLRLVHDLVRQLKGSVRLDRSDGTTRIGIELPIPEHSGGAAC
ncbi:MAG TPA: HAMP domain-containing histidine kinase [Aliiroseovarius sp.]|nr:HAMP domain-containing histidine kinase [Aliiroseovarius sp.]